MTAVNEGLTFPNRRNLIRNLERCIFHACCEILGQVLDASRCLSLKKGWIINDPKYILNDLYTSHPPSPFFSIPSVYSLYFAYPKLRANSNRTHTNRRHSILAEW